MIRATSTPGSEAIPGRGTLAIAAEFETPIVSGTSDREQPTARRGLLHTPSQELADV
jgi:hypothetical protein